MADFCWQCTEAMGINPELNDFKGHSTMKKTRKGLFPVVLCEGCGAIQVDHDGKCISEDCDCNGHKRREKV